eukprot:scpid30903/ scgid9615/ 
MLRPTVVVNSTMAMPWISGVLAKLPGFDLLQRAVSERPTAVAVAVGATAATLGCFWLLTRRRRTTHRTSDDEAEDGGVLVTLGYSHFCELGRWALDKPASGVGIPYKELSYPLGVHAKIVPGYRRGIDRGRKTHVPVFVAQDGTVYASSAEIVEYAGWTFSDAQFKDLMIESLGPAVRRLGYYHLLTVKPWMVRDMNIDVSDSWLHAMLAVMLWYWYGIPKRIMRAMKISGDYDPETDVALVNDIFQQVEERLSGAQYLGANGEFGAEDLAFAALGAVGIWPDSLPFGNGVMAKYPLHLLPEAFRLQVERWRQTVAGQHIVKTFQLHRS